MDRVTEIWNKRRSDYWSMAMVYWRLIGKNSGIMFVLYALFIFGSIYYKKWLAQLPADFPGALVITLAICFFIIHSPIRTFIQEADLVFMLPLEEKMSAYFQKSVLYNFFIQGAVVFVTIIIISPLYLATVRENSSSLFWFICLALLLKLINVLSNFLSLYFDSGSMLLKFFRIVATFLTLLLFLSGHMLVGIVIGILFAASVYLFCYLPSKGRLLNWEMMVEWDKRQVGKLLRFANLFTDVPELRGGIHSRQWLAGFVRVLPLKKEALYTRYFALTFIRASDFFGQWCRITIVGIILLVGYHAGYAAYVISGAAIYITGLQIFSLWDHPAPQATFHLYPVSDQLKKQGFLKVIIAVLIGQAVLLSVVGALIMGGITYFVFLLMVTILAMALFIFSVVRKRLNMAK